MEGKTKVSKNRSLFSIFVSGRGSSIQTHFRTPIVLDEEKDYTIALTSLHTWYSYPNISNDNNKFIYFDKVSWREINFPTGVYDITDINDKLQDLLPTKQIISIYGDETTLKACVVIESGYRVKFPATGGLSTLLGFNPGILESGTHQGNSIVEITNCNTCLVRTDLIETSYVRGERDSIIYCFNVDNLPGTRIVSEPKTLLYYPLALKRINHFSVTLLDQSLKAIDLRDEYLSVNFDIKEL